MSALLAISSMEAFNPCLEITSLAAFKIVYLRSCFFLSLRLATYSLFNKITSGLLRRSDSDHMLRFDLYKLYHQLMRT